MIAAAFACECEARPTRHRVPPSAAPFQSPSVPPGPPGGPLRAVKGLQDAAAEGQQWLELALGQATAFVKGVGELRDWVMAPKTLPRGGPTPQWHITGAPAQRKALGLAGVFQLIVACRCVPWAATHMLPTFCDGWGGPPRPPSRQSFIGVLHTQLLQLCLEQFKMLRHAQAQSPDVPTRSRMARVRGSLEREMRLGRGWPEL